MANLDVETVNISYPDVPAADVGTLLDGIFATSTTPVNVQVNPGASTGVYTVNVNTNQFYGSVTDVVAALEAYDGLS